MLKLSTSLKTMPPAVTLRYFVLKNTSIVLALTFHGWWRTSTVIAWTKATIPMKQSSCEHVEIDNFEDVSPKAPSFSAVHALRVKMGLAAFRPVLYWKTSTYNHLGGDFVCKVCVWCTKHRNLAYRVSLVLATSIGSPETAVTRDLKLEPSCETYIFQALNVKKKNETQRIWTTSNYYYMVNNLS